MVISHSVDMDSVENLLLHVVKLLQQNFQPLNSPNRDIMLIHQLRSLTGHLTVIMLGEQRSVQCPVVNNERCYKLGCVCVGAVSTKLIAKNGVK